MTDPNQDPLVQAKEDVIELAEALSCSLESQLDLEPTLRLAPAEGAKARHRLLAQIKKVAAELRRLNLETQRFGVHSF